MSRITLKNISSATVVVGSTNGNIKTRSLAPGRVITLTPEEYEDLMYEPGVQNMIRGGYIKIEGVEEDRAVIETPWNVKERDEIIKMLDNRDITAFAKYITVATSAAKDTIVQYVVENNITDNAFTALIKKYCDVDVIQAIAVKHQAEEK
jgi:hypothetical protein